MEIFHVRTYECSTAPEKNKIQKGAEGFMPIAMGWLLLRRAAL